MDSSSDTTKQKSKGKSPKKSKSENKNKYNLRKKKKKSYKIIAESSDEDDSDWLPGDSVFMVDDDDDHSEDTNEEEDVEEDEESADDEDTDVSEDDSEKKDKMDTRQLQKFIQKIFPSKAGKERLDQLDKIDKLMKKDEKKKSKKKKNKKLKGKNKKELIKKIKNKNKKLAAKDAEKSEKEEAIDSDSSDEDIIHNETLFDVEDEDEQLDEHEEELLKNNMKFNIVFTMGGDRGMFAPADIYDEDMDGDSEEEFMDKMIEMEKQMKREEKKYRKGARVIVNHPEWDKPYKGIITAVKKGKFNIKLDNDEDGEEFEELKKVKRQCIELVPEEEINEEKIMSELKDLMSIRKTKGRKAMVEQFDKICKVQEKYDKKKREREDKKKQNENVSKFRKLLREKNIMNDFKYFRTMPVENQEKIISQLEEVNNFTTVEKPYRLALLESDISVEFKANALKKINMLNFMDPGSGEYYKIKQWVDTFMRIPFGVHRTLPLKIDDGSEKCNNFMENAKKTLDEAVYGLDDAKMQIMQLVGQWISNPTSVGTAIAVKGPPGTGKTTLIKEGISKILNRPFSFLALGGATDSSFLEGHSYTYEGSTWGKIVDILINSKCMNPVFYFDELDKISDTPKGEEIAGILTHLTDTTQNQQFHDKYFSSVDFDVSKALFIFSYNDESKVNSILKDRMYRIHTAGYDSKQKITIARDYLIPKIEKNINFGKDEIIIPDETITHICNALTESEKGVRNLKRCLEIIYTKLNLYRLMKPDSKLFEKEKTIKVEFPFIVTRDIVDKLIKKNDRDNSILSSLYI
jgi:hypothetical protein